MPITTRRHGLGRRRYREVVLGAPAHPRGDPAAAPRRPRDVRAGVVLDASPHLLVPKMKAHFLIAVAADDDQKEPAARDTLKAAFAAAKLPAEIEVYAGTRHGWCPTDSPVYDHDQAEKAWARTLALFKTALV